MVRLIQKVLIWTGAAILTFAVCFLAMTALCDWLCHMGTYYQDAAKETYIQED